MPWVGGLASEADEGRLQHRIDADVAEQIPRHTLHAGGAAEGADLQAGDAILVNAHIQSGNAEAAIDLFQLLSIEGCAAGLFGMDGRWEGHDGFPRFGWLMVGKERLVSLRALTIGAIQPPACDRARLRL